MKAIVPLLLAAVLLPATPLVSADTLLLDAITEVPENIAHPSRYMSMEQVRAKFGDPQEESSPVGEPPITSWTYESFTVYFEHELVIETVIHRKQQ